MKIYVEDTNSALVSMRGPSSAVEARRGSLDMGTSTVGVSPDVYTPHPDFRLRQKAGLPIRNAKLLKI